MGLTPTSSARPVTTAWQPFTFGGVAAFAAAPRSRALMAAVAVAAVLALLAWRFAAGIWSPTIEVALARLPAAGAIEQGRLQWPTNQPLVLVDNAFLSVSVRPADGPAPDRSADVQFTFGPSRLKVSSLLGDLDLAYPANRSFSLNRGALEPLWGAWRPHVLLGITFATFAGLLIMWIVLATLLAVPIRLYGMLLGRALRLGGAWNLSLVALMPGAVLMGIALAAYSLRRLSLGEFLLASGAHLLVDAAYLLISPIFLPAPAASSPFAASVEADGSPASPAGNPFRGLDEGASEPAASPVEENDEILSPVRPAPGSSPFAARFAPPPAPPPPPAPRPSPSPTRPVPPGKASRPATDEEPPLNPS